MTETAVGDGGRSWRSRLGRSVQAVLTGLVLLVFGFPLLWWNEGRAVRAARVHDEGASEVVSLDAPVVVSDNEGRLVHVTGLATTEEMIRDPQFGISIRALRLRRTVEMYQWREEPGSGDRSAPPGGGELGASVVVSKVWSGRLVDSTGFVAPLEHSNPASIPVRSEERVVGRATIGELTLSSELVLQIDSFEVVRPETVPVGAPHGLRLDGERFFLGADPDRPEVGDLRVRFEAVYPVTVSVVARQERGRLEPYQSRSGRRLQMMEVGVHSAGEMFAADLNRNRAATWLLRLAGAALLFVGLATVLRPMAAVAETVPWLAATLRPGFGLVAAAAAVATTLVTMAFAWLSYRLLVGVGLVVGAVAVASLAAWLGQRRV